MTHELSETIPIDDIKVTPGMIGAAHEVLWEYYIGDGRYNLSDEALTDLFRAMLRSP